MTNHNTAIIVKGEGRHGDGMAPLRFPAEQVSEAFDDGGGFFMDAEVYTPPEVAVVPAPAPPPVAAAPASSDSKKPRGLKDLERERQAKARGGHLIAHRLSALLTGITCLALIDVRARHHGKPLEV